MRYERDSISQYLDQELDSLIQQPTKLKIKNTASIFQAELLYVRRLDITKFLVIDQN